MLVVDTETTGLHPDRGAGVVELAGVLLDLGPGGPVQVLGDWQSLVDPGHPVPPEASAVHHLVDEDLVGAPELPQACEVMWRDLGGWDYVFAHNAKFDRAFLPAFHNRGWGCTLKVAREVVADAPGYGNQVLRYFLRTSPVVPAHCGNMAHRALYDCYVTAYLLDYLVERMSVEAMVELSNRPQLQKRVGFGKHRGQAWRDLPRSYLYWILSQTGEAAFDEDVVHTARHYLGG